MKKDLVFKLVISDAGKDVFTLQLSYEAIANIVSSYSPENKDTKESNDFFALTAQHPASSVREHVAYNDNLSADVVNLLSQDSSIAVLRQLVKTSAFRENATEDLLDHLIKLDFEIAGSIASNVESFEHCDANKLAALLAAHTDPYVVVNLVQNYNTPKKVLKSLINHPDPYVASEAKARLKN